MHEKVMSWIKEQFIIDEIHIKEFPILPAGKVIMDKEGGKLLVFYDIFYEKVVAM